MLFPVQQVQAHDRFFWLLNIKSDMRMILHGLVSFNWSENKQSATLHHISHHSLTGLLDVKDSKGSALPKPLCMDNIVRHDWNNTPMRKVTFQRGFYCVENIPRKLGVMESLMMTITFVGLIAVPYMTEGRYFNGVEIPSTQTTASALIPSLCTVGGESSSLGSSSSPLGNFLNSALKGGAGHSQCSDPQNANLTQFIHLLAENHTTNTQPVYIPPIQTQGFYDQSQNELWLLVPNSIMIMLGLIPGSNNNNSLHRSPNRWTTSWFW